MGSYRWPRDRREEALSSRACFLFAGWFGILAATFVVIAARDDASPWDVVLAVGGVALALAWTVRGVITRRRVMR